MSFAAAGYGEFDGSVRPDGSSSISSIEVYGGASDQSLYDPSQSSSVMLSGGLSSPSIISISYGMAGLRSSSDSNLGRVFYGESSGSNKRPHVEEPQAPVGSVQQS